MNEPQTRESLTHFLGGIYRPVIIMGLDGTTPYPASVDVNGQLKTQLYKWNPMTLSWVPDTTTSEDPLAKYHKQDVDGNYEGYAAIDGSWYILRTVAGTTYRYAAGTSGYITAWTNRASLTYDYIFNWGLPPPAATVLYADDGVTPLVADGTSTVLDADQ